MNFSIRSYRESDRDDVIQLWKECELVVPWNNPQRDIERKQTVQAEFFLIGLIHKKIIATTMVGYEGHRGWVNYLAVKPKFQRQGIGKRMMENAEQRLLKLGCPKIQVQIRNTNDGVIKFYRKQGYIKDEVVNLGKRLIFDE
ncbi:MAG: GNAT family acetyltransferase [Calditrichia bacterium]